SARRCCATCRCTSTRPRRSSWRWWGAAAPRRPRSSTWWASCSTCVASCRRMPPTRWPPPSPTPMCAPVPAASASAPGRPGRASNEDRKPMIGRLRGTLAHKQPPWLVVDVGGVGYELEAPMSTFYDLPEVGREVTLFTHYAHKDDTVSLYGFLTEAERRMFRDVQKVSGIGAKIALAILSGASVGEFALLVQAGDITALCRIPGIGKKTAERILVELRDRAADFAGAAAAPSAGTVPADPMSEAVVARQQLGYRPAEAKQMARAAAGEGDAAEAIIRKALQSALRWPFHILRGAPMAPAGTGRDTP